MKQTLNSAKEMGQLSWQSQTWWAELDTLDLHGRRDSPPASCPVTLTHTHTHKHTHLKNENMIISWMVVACAFNHSTWEERQVISRFDASLDYRTSSRTARATQRNPVLKNYAQEELHFFNFSYDVFQRHILLLASVDSRTSQGYIWKCWAPHKLSAQSVASEHGGFPLSWLLSFF